MTVAWTQSMTLGERAARHLARFQRAQAMKVATAVTRGGRRPEMSMPIGDRLVGLEPISAATLRDAQLHGWLKGAVAVAGLVPDSTREKWAARSGPGIGLPPGSGRIGDGRPGSGSGRGSGPPRAPGGLFDDSGGPDKPVIRFPQIERGHEFIAGLTPLLPADFENASEQARRTAFTVARAQTLAAVEAVQDAVADDIRQGGTLKGFRAVVDEALNHALSDSQSEAIYRTYVGRAYSAGQVAVLDDPSVRTSVPYLLYSATHDSRVRPEHLSMEQYVRGVGGPWGLDGTAIYRADDPIWDLFHPPWAWNCRCMVIPLNVANAAERGVREAQEWLRTGRPPAVPQFVQRPPFLPPPGWVPSGRALSLAA